MKKFGVLLLLAALAAGLFLFLHPNHDSAPVQTQQPAPAPEAISNKPVPLLPTAVSRDTLFDTTADDRRRLLEMTQSSLPFEVLEQKALHEPGAVGVAALVALSDSRHAFPTASFERLYELREKLDVVRQVVLARIILSRNVLPEKHEVIEQEVRQKIFSEPVDHQVMLLRMLSATAERLPVVNRICTDAEEKSPALASACASLPTRLLPAATPAPTQTAAQKP